jgi:phenylpropionate dioxygenase-like ring-hydroxylating dioxygenase large terminal subunit
MLADRMAVDVRQGLEEGYTLPATWYADPAVYRLEQERIFQRTWQYAGRADLVTRPGDYFTCRAGEIPIVVVCDNDGRVNAFVNVCRHRWTEVVQGSGNRQTLQCPYHAWTYGLDGRLRNAPRSEREPSFDKSEFCLLPLQVDSWGPFLFVNADPDARPLAQTLGELPSLVAASGLDLGALRFREHVEGEIRANWKVVVENYLECYHCPVAHPSFSDLIDVDPDSYRLEAYEWFSSQIGPVRRSVVEGDGRPVAYDPKGPIVESQFHYVWPTFTLNVVPGPANALAFAFVPLGIDRTLTVSDYFFADDVSGDQARAVIEFGSEVGREDQELVESVQRALRSGVIERGRLLLSSEHLIQHFQKLVERALA